MKTTATTVLLVLMTIFSFGQKMVLKGSDTVLPFGQKAAESYMKKNTGKTISVVGGGSGVGIAALIDNSTDIAMASRKMKMDERMKVQDAGRSFKEVIICNDALSVIVHPSNKVSKLTREQIEGIYTGKIKNWKEVGGDDMQIVVYARETSSGTYEFFRDFVLKKKNYTSAALNMPASGAIVQSVSQTKGAIGYVGLAYLNSNIKDIAVSYDGKNFYQASKETAKNKTYPIIRPLYFYYVTTKEATVKPFIDYVLSEEGQNIADKLGYIKLKY